MIAFANAEGGTLVIGLRDGLVDGVSPKNENAFRQAAIDHTVPPVRARVSSREFDGKRVLVLRVEPGEAVHTSRAGDCYLRIGDKSRTLSLAEHQELICDRGNQPFESQAVGIGATDLSPSPTDDYREAIGSSSTLEMLRARDLVDRSGRLTVAAALLFDERPQRDFPSAYVRVLTYDADERGVGSEMALTEDIRIEIFPHRLEVTSPGRFPGLADPNAPVAISRYARNPRIARVCSDMGITRELGEGIKRIFHQMRRRGLEDPIYRQSSSSVTLVLNAADAVPDRILDSLTKSARTVLDTMRLQNRPLGTGQVAELTGIARPTAKRALESLSSAGLVRWEGKSDRDPRASWRLL